MEFFKEVDPDKSKFAVRPREVRKTVLLLLPSTIPMGGQHKKKWIYSFLGTLSLGCQNPIPLTYKRQWDD